MHDGLSERYHEKHRQLREAQRELRELRAENVRFRIAAKATLWRALLVAAVLGVVLGVAAAVVNARLEELRDVCTYRDTEEVSESVAQAPAESKILIVLRSGDTHPGEVF